MIELTFLGTSSMVPTKERNHSSVLISFKGNYILVDCGEGTQRQLKIAGISISKINKVLISHWHGDHVLGLPGLMQTLAANEGEKRIEVYGPKGTREKISYMLKAFEFDKSRINIEIKEVNAGKFFENSDFFLEALPLEHGIPSLGFNFIEKDRRRIEIGKARRLGLKEGPLLGKLQEGNSVTVKGRRIKPDDVSYIVSGKKITFISDTLPCKNAYKLAENSDLVVCEATYHSRLEEKGIEYNHMTAKQAASIANKSNAKQLILTHISARYKDAREVEDDARDIFKEAKCAYDFMKARV